MKDAGGIEMIQSLLEKFSEERKWDRFHSPKNLVMAITNELGELIELFQWLTEEQSFTIMENAESAQRIKEEIADVFLYLVYLAKKLKIDMIAEALEKIKKNAVKYPIEASAPE